MCNGLVAVHPFYLVGSNHLPTWKARSDVAPRCTHRRCKWRTTVLELPAMLKLVRHTIMYKICLSLAFSPQTGTWGKTRGKQKLLPFPTCRSPTCHSLQTDRHSPFGPKIVNHHDALNSFHLESIPNLQGVKTRLRWRTTLWGSKSETARVPAGAKWGAKGWVWVWPPPWRPST